MAMVFLFKLFFKESWSLGCAAPSSRPPRPVPLSQFLIQAQPRDVDSFPIVVIGNKVDMGTKDRQVCPPDGSGSRNRA